VDAENNATLFELLGVGPRTVEKYGLLALDKACLCACAVVVWMFVVVVMTTYAELRERVQNFILKHSDQYNLYAL
jgi:hypothetical protein